MAFPSPGIGESQFARFSILVLSYPIPILTSPNVGDFWALMLNHPNISHLTVPMGMLLLPKRCWLIMSLCSIRIKPLCQKMLTG